ncbi:MAG: hypothetical protein IJ481_00405 [Alphaproteobacteria bacterium]|nr:hypothetical protein [Alphaproteobacteria bacterium]
MIRQVFGYICFLIIAFLIKERNDSDFKSELRLLFRGIIFHIVLAFALTKSSPCISAIEWIASGVMKLKDATIEGTKLVFGYIGGGDLPFSTKPNASAFVFAFQALPTVIIVSALSAILTYLRILPILSKVIGSIFKLVFNIDSSIGIVAAAKIFIGQIEAPLLIKDKLNGLTRENIFVILTLAFATSSVAVTPIYAGLLDGICQDPMRHLLASSVMSVVSSLIVSNVIFYRTKIATNDKHSELPYSSFMNAMSKGISDGAFVWWCIVGSLIGMVALVALLNYMLGILPNINEEPITLQKLLGYITYPFVWLLGIEPGEILTVSGIVGTKIAINETVAFLELAKANLSSESIVKTIYAINNFGNFACIGITIAGLSALAPNQKSIQELAGKAFIAAFLATGLTATLISFFL